MAVMRIATSERRKVDGEWSDHTEWHTVSCFGKTAENCGRYLTRGRQISVEGRIQTRKWTDKDGRDRWSTEIIAEQIEFLGGGGDEVRRDAQKPAEPQRGHQGQSGDIPF